MNPAEPNRIQDQASKAESYSIAVNGMSCQHCVAAVERAIREVPGLKKKPSTSELLDWIKLLLAEDIPPEALRGDDSRKAIPPLYGALLKNEQDVHLFEQLVFLDRRSGSSQ
mgnify:CR=1 FL=1